MGMVAEGNAAGSWVAQEEVVGGMVTVECLKPVVGKLGEDKVVGRMIAEDT